MTHNANNGEKRKTNVIEDEPSGSSLLPMLIAGLVLIVIGMSVAMMIS